MFTAEYTNPVNDTPQNRRKNLRQAAKLLNEAGWKVTQDGGRSLLKNAKGEPLTIEFLLDSPLFERIALPYQQQLELLGIGVTIKTVDSAQYERRTQTFDFDIVVGNWGQSLSPGNEQRDFWGSEAAKRNGSRNLVGIANPAIDKLIETLIFAPDRDSLVTACKALDRALLWNHYVVPMWYIDYERTARWDRFGRPEKLPDLSTGLPHRVVVGCGEGKEGGRPVRRAAAAVLALAALRSAAAAEPRHGISVFGDLKYPAGLHAFRLCESGCAEGRQDLAHRARRRSRPSTASTATS